MTSKKTNLFVFEARNNNISVCESKQIFWCCHHLTRLRIEFFGGNYSGVVPPDPIPNSEVKYTKADGSALARE